MRAARTIRSSPAALTEATSVEEKIKALLETVSYYSSISEYGVPLNSANKRYRLCESPALNRYSCETLTLLGVSYFTSFEDVTLASIFSGSHTEK